MTDPSTKNTASTLRPVLIAVLLGASFFFSVIFILSPDAFSQKNSNDASPLNPGEEVYSLRAPAPPPEPGNKASRYDFRLTESDTFYRVLSILGVPGPEIQNITERARPVYDLRQLKKDALLKAVTQNNLVERIEYRFNDFEVLNIERDAKAVKGFRVSKTELPHETRETRVTGSIESSLYEDGIKAGADPQAIMSLSDIFAWDIDFASDIRKGDTFSILYETIYVEGRPLKTGRILGAEMVNGGKKFSAIYFEGGGDRGGYYNAEGKSLARSLLKSPLRFRRITSYFGRRFHPILKQYKPHHGIDYAASAGTPVESAGSGHVTFAGWKRGYGNFIEIRHNNGYSTAYGHLLRISKGVRPGAKVLQGDVIGLVGSTGLSTGPHLHYEVRSSGRLINPLGIKSEPDRALARGEMPRFASLRDQVAGKLSGETAVASSAPSVPLHPLTGTDRESIAKNSITPP